VSTDALPSWSDLLALVEHLETTDFEDFVVEMPGLTVRVSRRGLADVTAVTPDADTPHVGTPDVVTLDVVTLDVVTQSAAAADELTIHPGNAEITAPIIGVFFRRPAPDQPPFVAVGDDVVVGTTTAIIEVMKMMVPVEASVAGRILAVLADDGDLVEFGQPLFVVDTSGVT
jgi:acetyl-CoA carboxylase biotin carboxyl carrier protein